MRIAMHQIAQLSPEFRRDLGLVDATIDDLVAHEDYGDFAAARSVVFGPGNGAAPGASAPATSR